MSFTFRSIHQPGASSKPYVFATSQRLENRGFLTETFLPSYGFGGLLLIVYSAVRIPFLVFIGRVIVTSALEHLTHPALDTIFPITLWNYSDKSFTRQGRICLQNSFLFGVLGLLLICGIQPALSKFIAALPSPVAISIASALLAQER